MSETLSTRALNMLVARIIEEEGRRALHLVQGSAASFEDYRNRVGFIQGLNHARTLCEDVERDLYGKKKD